MASLADLLGEPALGLAPVVDRRRGDPVRWVATSELDDPAPFLEGGEVLLTTGLETTGWTEEWEPYVRRLADAQVVAIGLALGLTYDQAPAELARACRRHGVDLFEVPRETRFVAISQALVAHLRRQEDDATRQALEAQRALTQAALREDEPDALLEKLAAVAGAAVVLGADGAVRSGPFGERADLLEGADLPATVARIRPQGLRAAASVASAGATVLVQPIGVRGRPERYLATAFRDRVGDAERSTVTAAVSLLSLAEERGRARRETERRLRTRAVELLVAGDARTAQLLVDAIGGRRLRLPRTAVVLRSAGPAPRLEEALEASETELLAGLVTADDVVELVIVARAAAAPDLAAGLAARGLRVGIGEPGPSDHVRTSHETAGHALRLTTSDAPVVAWADGVRRGALALMDAGRARAFAATYLAPLEADRALTETLSSFLRHHGSLLKVADDLGVHRNTVRHRVERIEALLGRSLADPQARVDAWLALQADA